MSYKIHLHSIIFTNILILLSSFCYAQSITWQRAYNSQFWKSDDGSDVAVSDSNNIYVTGYAKSSNNTYSLIYVLKINKFGDTLWTKIFGDSTYGGSNGNAIVPSENDGCVIAGEYSTKVIVKKFDSGGNMVWENIFTGPLGQTIDLTSTPDGNFIGCGRASYYNGYIFKIDPSGRLLWQKEYPSGYYKIFWRVIPALDNGYILAGSFSNYNSDTSKACITKIDTNGNILWEKSFQFYERNGFSDLCTSGYQYLASGITSHSGSEVRVFIKRLNITGDEVFSKLYYYQNTDYEDHPQLKSINPNKFILSVIRDTFSYPIMKFYSKIMLLDSMGVIKREKNYFSNYDLEINSAIVINQNSYILTGGVEGISNSWSDVYLLKTDSTLDSPPIGIKPVSNYIPSKFKLNQNYPNPFNPQTSITFEIPEQSLVKLKVFDILGREIETLVNEIIKPGIYKTDFNGINLSSGVYIYSISVNGILYDSKKMILIR